MTHSDSQRRRSQSLRDVLAEFLRYPSPYLLAAALAAAITGRLLIGGGSWWELVIPGVLLALLPLVEWVFHIVVLHWRPRSLLGLRIDPLLSRKHREHHADPTDVPLIFIPWQTQLWLMIMFVGLSWLVTPTWPAMFTMLVSVYVLLTGYEWTHFLMHRDYRPRSRWYRMAWRNHRLHHFKNEHYWFAVTTAGTVDRPLRTYPDPGEVPTSPTVKKLHATP